MATSIPQAGTRMSLISKGDIRYEGVLSHIDMGKSEICLTQGEAGSHLVRHRAVQSLHLKLKLQPPSVFAL